MEAREFKELLRAVEQDYPDFCFRTGKKFAFRPPRTIVVPDFTRDAETSVSREEKPCSAAEQKICSLRLLHELGHATLGHRNFATDIERLRMERAAWDRARKFCQKYGVEYDENFVETELDTYRDWLHQRSTCRNCGQTRYQTADSEYHCPFCDPSSAP